MVATITINSNISIVCQLRLKNIQTAPLLRCKTPFFQNEATCLPWVATCNTWGCDPVGWAVWIGKWSCNRQLNNLALTGLDKQFERPGLIIHLVMLIPGTYMIKSQPYTSNCSRSKQTSNSFYHKGGGWGSIALRKDFGQW